MCGLRLVRFVFTRAATLPRFAAVVLKRASSSGTAAAVTGGPRAGITGVNNASARVWASVKREGGEQATSAPAPQFGTPDDPPDGRTVTLRISRKSIRPAPNPVCVTSGVSTPV